MPTVLRIGAYRFFFYANENSELHHIHIQRERALAKFCYGLYRLRVVSVFLLKN